MDYGDGLENRFRESERGFESHPLRQRVVINIIAVILINRRNQYKRRELDENPRIPGQGAAIRIRHPGPAKVE